MPESPRTQKEMIKPLTSERRRYWLTYDAERTTQPLIWEMSQKFDVVFNIRSASVNETVGIIAIELEGQGGNINRAVRWFQRKGVEVDPVEMNAIEG